MKKVDHKQLARTLEVFHEKRKALMIWGPPGIGKSQLVEEAARNIAKKKNLEFSKESIENGKFGFIDIRISQLDPSDLRGLPFGEGGRTKWLIPSFFPSNKDGCGIIFLDEINLAPPSIQAAAYQLILDGRLGDYILPKGWSIVAAGNRTEDKAFTFELARPLANRFSHLELEVPQLEPWAQWAGSHGVDGRIVSFALWEKRVNDADIKNKDQAFLTPRSLATAGQLIINIDDDEMLETLTASSCGPAFGIRFVAFNKLTRKIDVEEALDDPKILKAIEDKIDQKYALIGAITEHWRNLVTLGKKPEKDKTIEKIFNLGIFIEPEFAILMLRLVMPIEAEYFKASLTKSPAGEKISKKFVQYL